MTAETLRYSAFTSGNRGGNPAGVVLDARGLSDEQMLHLAQHVGYSETAFVVPQPEADAATLSLRFFSPIAEVAFCGHATVATAVALAERQGTGPLDFSTPAGPVRVHTWTDGSATGATLTSPPASSHAAAEGDVARTLESFGLSASDLDPHFPVHVAFAGNHHLVLPLASRQLLRELSYDFDELGALMAERSWTTVHVFWAENDATFHARNPFPPGGVVEDPATGAAAAAFGGYLRQIGVLAPPAEFAVLQGHDMGSPSELLVRLDQGVPGVQVSGRATRLPDEPR